MLRTKFRIANCLVGQDGDYCMRKCAITEDGRRHVVETMEDGTEYFRIDNPYGNGTLLTRTFSRKIGDAIQSIVDDYADTILVGSFTNVFTSFNTPVVFIDREIGEEYHSKAKEECKDIKYGYSIVYGSKNSIGRYHAVDVDGFYARENGPKIYETKNEAREKFEEWFNTAHKLAHDYVTYYNTQDDEHFKEVKQELDRCSFTIVGSLAFDMIDDSAEYEELKLVDNIRTLPHIGWDFQQEIIFKKK